MAALSPEAAATSSDVLVLKFFRHAITVAVRAGTASNRNGETLIDNSVSASVVCAARVHGFFRSSSATTGDIGA
jgi:hypothetical protein